MGGGTMATKWFVVEAERYAAKTLSEVFTELENWITNQNYNEDACLANVNDSITAMASKIAEFEAKQREYSVMDLGGEKFDSKDGNQRGCYAHECADVDGQKFYATAFAGKTVGDRAFWCVCMEDTPDPLTGVNLAKLAKMAADNVEVSIQEFFAHSRDLDASKEGECNEWGADGKCIDNGASATNLNAENLENRQHMWGDASCTPEEIYDFMVNDWYPYVKSQAIEAQAKARALTRATENGTQMSSTDMGSTALPQRLFQIFAWLFKGNTLPCPASDCVARSSDTFTHDPNAETSAGQISKAVDKAEAIADQDEWHIEDPELYYDSK